MGKRKSSAGTGCLFIVALLIVGWLINEFSLKKKQESVKKPKASVVQKEEINWRSLADDIIIDYRGKIAKIRQLNSSTCWAVLSPKLSAIRAIEVAENIGYYVKNVTGKTPTVRVFLNGKHIAMARPSGNKYKGKIDIQDWMAWDMWE